MDKLDNLKEIVRDLKSVAVAFSAGVDSSFLLKIAHDELGDKCLALTALSEFFPKTEQEETKEFCRQQGIRHISFYSDEINDPEFAKNPRNRCYICKHKLFSRMLEITKEEGLDCLVEGSNLDDLGDYRPGLEAIRELRVRSPLREAGLTKAEIRDYSKQLGLPTWKKPSFACLATRIPYGESITKEKLAMIEQGEEILARCGFSQYRVRMHGQIARIEILPEEFEHMMDPLIKNRVTKELKEAGFSFIALDLDGYRTGSLN